MNNVLITGGAGFIGSHVSKALCEIGYNVSVIDILLHGNKLSAETSKNVSLLVNDVCDASVIDNATKKCDIIIHLAAYLGIEQVCKEPVKSMIIEQQGMNNIISSAKKNNVKKIIYASSSSVYGTTLISKAVNEKDFVCQQSPYAIAKRYNEVLLKSFSKETGINTCSLRFFNVYGPSQDCRMVIPRFIDSAINNKHLNIYENGLQTRDFTYIKDVVKSIILLMDKTYSGNIFNICTGIETSINDIADKIVHLSNSNSLKKYSKPNISRKDYEVMRRFGDSSLLNYTINYIPST